MIFYSGSGGGAVLVFVLVFLGMFVLLPILFFTSAARSVRSGPGRPWSEPPPPRPPAPPLDPAEVRSVLDRLGHDVRTLEPGDDVVSRQAMADASERYATASGQLEAAGSQDQLRTAWLAGVEGLHATRLVRQRLGLDPGPAPALPPPSGPQLQQRSRVLVDGREHIGSPTYQPGQPYWFPGGRYGRNEVPGGWYAEPFWPGDLMLGVLSGWALGSLMTGGMYGGMYGAGWGDGDGGGDWAGSGGDVGGGDWGGFGGGDVGGGDWGGFGDVGGGDFGGGDW